MEIDQPPATRFWQWLTRTLDRRRRRYLRVLNRTGRSFNFSNWQELARHCRVPATVELVRAPHPDPGPLRGVCQGDGIKIWARPADDSRSLERVFYHEYRHLLQHTYPDAWRRLREEMGVSSEDDFAEEDAERFAHHVGRVLGKRRKAEG